MQIAISGLWGMNFGGQKVKGEGHISGLWGRGMNFGVRRSNVKVTRLK